MVNDPKKLAVTKVGASDNTFFLQFELDSQKATSDIPMGVIASIGNEAAGQGFNLGTSYPPNEVINLMASFNLSTGQTTDIPAVLSFTFVNSTNGTINYGDINYEIENHYPSLEQVKPKNTPLEAKQSAVFQCTKNKGNFTFLTANPKGGTPYASPVFISSNPYFNFSVILQDANKQYYTIQVKESGDFLIDKDGVLTTGTSPDPFSDPSFLWCFKKESNSPLSYSIRNVQTDTYLSAKTTNSKVELEATPSTWYLHIEEE